MVAEPRRPRILALTMVLAFLAISWLPASTAQFDTILPEIHVVRGKVDINPVESKMPVVVPGPDVVVRVTVENTGGGGADAFPVYAYLKGQIEQAQCRGISLAAGASGTVTFRFGGTDGQLAAGDNVVYVLANEQWNSAWGDAPPCPKVNNNNVALRPESIGDKNDARPAAHIAWGHFVVNETIDLQVHDIRWCSGGRPLSNADGCDEDMQVDGQSWKYNTTAYAHDKPTPSTFFVVDVMNVGNHSSMKYLGHKDCESDFEVNGTGDPFKVNPETCGEFEYDLQARVSRLDGTGATDLATYPAHELEATFDHWKEIVASLGPVPANVTHWITAGWSLVGLKGDYKITVNIDPTGTNLTEKAISNNQGVRDDLEVRWVDFNVTFGNDFRTSIDNPYPYLSNTLVSGVVNFTNDGKADALRDDSPINLSIYVDDGKFPHPETLQAGLGQGGWEDIQYSFRFSTDPEDPAFLAPGKHTLYARIDQDYDASPHYAGFWNETNETNNLASLVFYIEDETAPVFTPTSELPTDSQERPTHNPLLRVFVPNQADSDATLGPSDTVVRPAQVFNVHARVTDDGTNMTVVANFTYDDDSNVTREYPMTLSQSEATRYSANIRNFTLHDHANETRSSQNWTLRVVATDATGNKETSGPVNIKVEKWGIHMASEDYFVLGQPQNTTYSWSSPRNPYYHVRLFDNMTGYTDQWNVTENLELIVDPPGDTLQGQPYTIGPEGWVRPDSEITSEERAACNQGGSKDVGGIGDPLQGDLVECPIYGELQAVFSKTDPGAPGIWNATIVVRDLAGEERRVNRSFRVVDEVPTFADFNLTNLTDVTIDRIEAGRKFNVTVSMIDDFDVNVSAVHVNFTRSDGVWRNVTLDEHEDEPEGSSKRYWFNKTIETGRFKDLDLAGTFDVTVQAADVNGNWGTSPVVEFVVEDSVEPTLSAGVTPEQQEDGEKVTFWAESTDQTNVTVKLVVSRDNVEVYNATLDHVQGNNYSHTTNFTRTGRYAWTMVAYDGNVAPLPSETRSGNLLISDNLGPRFDVSSPSFSVDGVRYSNAAPRLEVVISDSDSVDADSVRLTIDGVEVDANDYDLNDPPLGFRGYTLVYAMPQNYEHNDTVVVRLNATDLSNRSLSNEVGFSFRIDDSAPVSRMVSFEPRYRALEGDPWNVSLDTEFTISAVDDDGMPTDVESIRFTVIGGGSSTAETVYSGPFKLRDIPDAYTGPRIYLIQFYAEDDVGNRERPANQISVSVDDTPPQLDPFGSLPQGRYVNVTFVDDASGVEKAVAWHKLNDAPYKPLALERDGDIWRGVLPEGKKGDQVSYFLEAWDRVGNSDTAGNESEPYSSYTVGNHVPVIRITSPLLGQRVSANVDLEWSASDEDDDALSFKVYLKAPGRANFAELITLDASDARSHVIDSKQFADGQYVLAVTASDGTFVSRAETTVTFINSGRAIERGSVSSDRVTPEEGVLITASISKAQAVVEARVYRNGEFVEAFAMNDAGESGDLVANDGIYSVRASFARSGTYSVEILSRYQENGEAKEDRMVDAASFTVRLTPGTILAEYWILWLGLVTLAFAAVGVAGFGLYKKWR